MPGFVWVKTITGTRTAGFFAFQARDGMLYASDGTRLNPPPGSVMLHGDALLTAISKSTPKGVYVRTWMETQSEWSRYVSANSQSISSSISCRPDYFMLNNAVASIVDNAGIPTPHNRSTDVVAEMKADARVKREKIELDFRDKIETDLRILKPLTVPAPRLPASCLATRGR